MGGSSYYEGKKETETQYDRMGNPYAKVVCKRDLTPKDCSATISYDENNKPCDYLLKEFLPTKR